MEINFYAILAAALSSFVVGFIWYNPKVFGTIWMKEIGMTDEKAKEGNMLKIFGLTFVFAFLLAFFMQPLTIHQFSALGMVGGDAVSAKPSYGEFMNDYGDAFRTFKHGAFHGILAGLFISLPVIATNCLFEQKSFKYAAITSGYWIVVMSIMGGIICAWK
ncbi:DUF1761 domain-containing protein [Flavobacterium sp.]|uniref:DUF1761 domain-containing protein n=1 Tax=Flavobacterium sp. TaxID=239 RepID=UPI003D2A8C7D